MSDLIDRGALLEKRTYMWDEALGTCACVLVSDIKEAPAVDAEPVRHMEWVNPHGMCPPEYHHRHMCSACGGWAYQDYYGRERLSPYCPNCGAKMDGGKENA